MLLTHFPTATNEWRRRDILFMLQKKKKNKYFFLQICVSSNFLHDSLDMLYNRLRKLYLLTVEPLVPRSSLCLFTIIACLVVRVALITLNQVIKVICSKCDLVFLKFDCNKLIKLTMIKLNLSIF